MIAVGLLYDKSLDSEERGFAAAVGKSRFGEGVVDGNSPRRSVKSARYREECVLAVGIINEYSALTIASLRLTYRVNAAEAMIGSTADKIELDSQLGGEADTILADSALAEKLTASRAAAKEAVLAKNAAVEAKFNI